MEDKNEIKPCPFCGSKSVLNPDDTTIQVRCDETECGAEGRHFDVSDYDEETQAEDGEPTPATEWAAIVWWNRRA